MLNVLICDDNLIIQEKVNNLVLYVQERLNANFLITIHGNADFDLQEKVYDIAIVDIELPGISGLKLAEALKKNNPDTIILILTSFSKYLDSAMKIQVFRYLSKPIDDKRFIRNFIEAIDYYKSISKDIIITRLSNVYKIKTKDILYIENQKHGSIIYTKNGAYNTNTKPIEWYNIINQPNCFVFSHKSYLVNLQNVIYFSR